MGLGYNIFVQLVEQSCGVPDYTLDDFHAGWLDFWDDIGEPSAYGIRLPIRDIYSRQNLVALQPDLMGHWWISYLDVLVPQPRGRSSHE